MDQKMYKQILIRHMRPSMMQLGGKETIIFQQDKDPKYDPNLGTPIRLMAGETIEQGGET